MKKILFLLFFAILCWNIAAQRGGDLEVTASNKYALVIGNANYSFKPLKNPVNDAYDINAAMKDLDWNVEILIDVNKNQMESGLTRLKNRLSASRGSHGFLYYAGHAVQRDGENYLIPVDIKQEDNHMLKDRAVSVQKFLDELNKTGNELNIVVLDACRDDPFEKESNQDRNITERSYGSVNEKRGLERIDHPPTNSIIVFATKAGSVAKDGDGRNGLYTSHLLNNLRIPGISVRDLFDKTSADVFNASRRQQEPAIYSQIYRYDNPFYIGPAPPPIPMNVRTGTPGTDKVTLNWDSAGAGISYKIYYNTQNDPASANALPNLENGTSKNVSGLSNGTTYYFWVSSVQKKLESAKSTVVSVRTAAVSSVKTYKIGDRGPGGGIVYYISDDGQNGKEVADLNLRRGYMFTWDAVKNYRGGGFKDWRHPNVEECDLIVKNGIGKKLSSGRYWTWSLNPDNDFLTDFIEFAEWYDFKNNRTGALPMGLDNLLYRVLAYRYF